MLTKCMSLFGVLYYAHTAALITESISDQVTNSLGTLDLTVHLPLLTDLEVQISRDGNNLCDKRLKEEGRIHLQ